MKKTRNGNKIFFAFVIILILIAGSLMGILAGYLISDKNNSKDEMVSDAFCEVIKDNNLTHCYHIPKINCNAEGIDEVNNEIYNDLYSLYENNVIKSQREEGFIVMGSMTYSYETKDNALSIVIQLQDARSLEYDYFVYNVDTKNGCKMKNKDLYELFGTDEASFNASNGK